LLFDSILRIKLRRSVALIRMIKLDAKKVMTNENGSEIWYAMRRRSIPKMIKKSATNVKITWVIHHGMVFSIICYRA
jgi:hypothetical protein